MMMSSGITEDVIILPNNMRATPFCRITNVSQTKTLTPSWECITTSYSFCLSHWNVYTDSNLAKNNARLSAVAQTSTQWEHKEQFHEGTIKSIEFGFTLFFIPHNIELNSLLGKQNSITRYKHLRVPSLLGLTTCCTSRAWVHSL